MWQDWEWYCWCLLPWVCLWLWSQNVHKINICRIIKYLVIFMVHISRLRIIRWNFFIHRSLNKCRNCLCKSTLIIINFARQINLIAKDHAFTFMKTNFMLLHGNTGSSALVIAAFYLSIYCKVHIRWRLITGGHACFDLTKGRNAPFAYS